MAGTDDLAAAISLLTTGLVARNGSSDRAWTDCGTAERAHLDSAVVRRQRFGTGLLVLGIAGAVVAVLVHHWLFPLYSLNRDDSVYVGMARVLESGHVTLPASDDAFRPWASAVLGDRIVFKYTLPWPAVLALADALTGTTVTALALTAAAAAVLTALLATEVLRDRTAGLIAGALLVLSPVVAVQSGTYLPYLFELDLALGVALLLFTGVRRESTARVVAAGAVLGVAGWARPFDAVLAALPFVVLALVEVVHARRDGGPWGWPGLLLRLAAGAAPFGAAVLVYDAVVTGHPLRLPYTVTGSQDGFGFGRRGVFPVPQAMASFTPADGVDGLLTNLRWVPGWTAGGIVVVLLAVLGLWRTRGRARWAVAALAVVVPLGYLPFYGPYAMSRNWDGVRLFGYYYHLPVVVPLVMFAAAALVGLARAARTSRSAWARPAVALFGVAVVALTALSLPDKVSGNLAVRDDYWALQRFVDAQHLDDAVLLLPWRGDLGFLGTSPFLENSPSLDQPVLYAAQRGGADLELAARFPDRALYRLEQDLPPRRTTGGRLSLQRLRVDAGPSVTVSFRLTDPGGLSDPPATVEGGDVPRSRPLGPATGGGWDVSWTVVAPGAPPPAGTPEDEVVRLPAGATSGVLTAALADAGSGAAGDAPARAWAQRIAYRVVDGGARVELLVPGEGWARAGDPGTDWAPQAVGNPVQLR